MATTEQFAPVRSLWPLVQAVAEDVAQWAPEYLAALDRQSTGTARDRPKLAKAEPRHGPFWRRDEQTPLAVVWMAGVREQRTDPDGVISGQVELGVLLAVSSSTPAATGKLVHDYDAAVRALLWDLPTARGECQQLMLVDQDFTRANPETRGDTHATSELLYRAHGVLLGRQNEGLPPGTDPRADPKPPWPPTPTFTSRVGPDTRPRREPLDPEDP